MKAILPWRSKPKARPLVTKNGTFMPHEYMEWKQNAAGMLSLAARGTIDGPVKLDVVFDSEDTTVYVTELPDYGKRAKHVKADLDNLIGGIMDALEDALVLVNDRQVVEIQARVVAR